MVDARRQRQSPDELFEEFESVCGMASDGAGMVGKEMLTCLLQSLEGHRKKIYNQEMKVHRQSLLKEDPQAVYKIIKDRLMEFQEHHRETDQAQG